MKMKHIEGSLIPTNSEAVTEKTRRKLLMAVREQGLSGLVQSGGFAQGAIEINSCTVASGGLNVVFGFIGALDRVILTEGVAELGLEGSIMLSVDKADAGPIMFRVTVRDGEISYQQASYVWAENTPYGR